jgi:hypothetical protein
MVNVPEVEIQQRAQQVRAQARDLFIATRNREPQFRDSIRIKFGQGETDSLRVMPSTGEVYYEGAPRNAAVKLANVIWVRYEGEILERIAQR